MNALIGENNEETKEINKWEAEKHNKNVKKRKQNFNTLLWINSEAAMK